MPLAFPSHQGLALPLRRWFPKLDVLALCVGAAVPDVVDLAAFPFRRGELGQGIGHSLLGLVIACLPVGLALTWVARRVVPSRWLARLARGQEASRRSDVVLGVLLGALSHVVTDFVTHANFVLLWPCFLDAHVFPDWWTHAWLGIPVFVYRKPYPLAPHTIAWFVMSVVGAVLFVRYVRAPEATRAG